MARSQRIEIRVTPEEKGLLKVLAERHHTDVAGWIRQRIFSDESGVPGEVVPYRPEPAERRPVVVESRTPETTSAESQGLANVAEQMHAAAALRIAERKCERCHEPYESPTLRRCRVCNGRILPEPE